jgi:hypothetical protein
MSRKQVRVEIPRDPSEDIGLLGKIKKQHDKLGDASPLKGMEWEKEIAPALARATEHDELAEKFRKDSEREMGERNKDMPTVMDAIRGARDVLKGLYRKNPKMLVDFGFDVSDSPLSGGDDDSTKTDDGKK